jgi:hypothetical protein
MMMTYPLGSLLLHTAAAEHATHAASAKELGEEVFRRHAAAHTGVTVEALLTILIVDRTLLGV